MRGNKAANRDKQGVGYRPQRPITPSITVCVPHYHLVVWLEPER